MTFRLIDRLYVRKYVTRGQRAAHIQKFIERMGKSNYHGAYYEIHPKLLSK